MTWRVQALQLGWPYGGSPEERRQEVSARATGLDAFDLLVLPELWPTGFFRFDDYAATAEPLDGPTIGLFSDLARRRGSHILAGSFIERTDDGALHNTSVLLGPDGTPLLVYRKVHLFGYQSRERELLTAGGDLPVVQTSLGALGVGTCYDLRFPEFHRMLNDAGAEVVLVPSAWPAARIPHWKLFLRARAVENQVFMVGCNAAGTDGANTYGGASAVIDPVGDAVAELGAEPGVLVADVDPDRVTRVRADFPVLLDRVLTGSAGPEASRRAFT
jgi:predicted amidohydrolase